MSILCQPWSNHHREPVCSTCIESCREGPYSRSFFLSSGSLVVAPRKATPELKWVVRRVAVEFKDEVAAHRWAVRWRQAAAHHRRAGLAPMRGPIPWAAWLQAEPVTRAEPHPPVAP